GSSWPRARHSPRPAPAARRQDHGRPRSAAAIRRARADDHRHPDRLSSGHGEAVIGIGAVDGALEIEDSVDAPPRRSTVKPLLTPPVLDTSLVRRSGGLDAQGHTMRILIGCLLLAAMPCGAQHHEAMLS